MAKEWKKHHLSVEKEIERENEKIRVGDWDDMLCLPAVVSVSTSLFVKVDVSDHGPECSPSPLDGHQTLMHR